MNLAEAAAHIDGPVLCYEFDGRAYPKLREGVVREVSVTRRAVRVEMRYTSASAGYRLTGRCLWWTPSLLRVPQWWLDRQPAAGSEERQ
ncbi:hypothetical protein BDK92_7135 [Micromonospora pisi]|uniref:WYL domain-containing protein n=1 Tax=Micromonospora pisi TaxID=589240 RepID=A0A495JWV9_9ACTN|nr:hypothetical protein [Micromonospora pisi]RKR92659.1 hypothetical protein BDK92_7135 [Micromonospora pisi]